MDTNAFHDPKLSLVNLDMRGYGQLFELTFFFAIMRSIFVRDTIIRSKLFDYFYLGTKIFCFGNLQHSVSSYKFCLSISENPFHCDCTALWLYDWFLTNSTSIRLPTCNSPDLLKEQQLEKVPWEEICPEDNATFPFRYMTKGKTTKIWCA